MNETSPEARALKRAAHERMAELLADPISADMAGYLPPSLANPRGIALLTRLEKRKRSLLEQRYRLIEKYNLTDDELVVIVPRGDLPLPGNLTEIQFYGMHLRLGATDDTYRVVIESPRFPAHVTPTVVRA
jgi:hypothetical protein